MNKVHAALAQPDVSWSLNRSPRIAMKSQIHATSTMNQKIETVTSHRDIPGSFGQERLAGVCRSETAFSPHLRPASSVAGDGLRTGWPQGGEQDQDYGGRTRLSPNRRVS